LLKQPESHRNEELLFRVCNYFQADAVLEIGTSLGLATSAISLETRSTNNDTEGCPEKKIAQEQLENLV
jgi:predicted O-methyltransferase YrrM